MRLSIKGVSLTPLNNLNKKDNTMNQEKLFFNYCWEFYGPNGIYGKTFFNNTLTKKELKTAITVRMRILTCFANQSFDYDSIDREIVRDTMIILRNPNATTEHLK